MRPDVTDSVMKSALKEITKGKIFIVWLTVPYHVLHFKSGAGGYLEVWMYSPAQESDGGDLRKPSQIFL